MCLQRNQLSPSWARARGQLVLSVVLLHGTNEQEGLAIMDTNTDRKSALLMGMSESKPSRWPLVFALQRVVNADTCQQWFWCQGFVWCPPQSSSDLLPSSYPSVFCAYLIWNSSCNMPASFNSPLFNPLFSYFPIIFPFPIFPIPTALSSVELL